jgi:hypothetical protein
VMDSLVLLMVPPFSGPTDNSVCAPAILLTRPLLQLPKMLIEWMAPRML